MEYDLKNKNLSDLLLQSPPLPPKKKIKNKNPLYPKVTQSHVLSNKYIFLLANKFSEKCFFSILF